MNQSEECQVSEARFKRSMSLWPTGVMIMTAQKGGERTAVTINSWASSSLCPPLVSFYLKVSAWCDPVFSKHPFFGVHLLSTHQQDLAAYYATPGGKLWVHGDAQHPHGSPLLKQSLMSLECQRVRRVRVGDHHLFVGRVVSIQPETEGQPLVYWARKYQKDLSLKPRDL